MNVHLQIGAQESQLTVESEGTIIPRKILAKYFNISAPIEQELNGESMYVFRCSPKSEQELTDIAGNVSPEELENPGGRGYLIIAANLSLPGDAAFVAVPKTTKLINNQWPEGVVVPHQMIIHAATHHPQPEARIAA